MYFNIIIAGIVISTFTSFIYLNIWLQKKERFLAFWGLSCVVYLLSLICLLIYFNVKEELLLEIRKLIDMLNILLILFGVFAFMHTITPTYWYRFFLYMLLLAGVCILYDVDLLSFNIPISMFQFATTVIIIYNIGRYWDMSSNRKIFAGLIFSIWGITKSVLFITVLDSAYISGFYTFEITMSFVLNLCILTIYMQHMQEESKLTGHLYRTLVENATDVIFYYKVEPYSAFEYVTPSVKKVTGYGPNSFYKNPRFYIDLVDHKYIDTLRDILNGKIQSDEGHIMEFIGKNGEKFWGEIKTSIIKEEKKGHIAVEGVLHDITAMKSSEIEQIKSKQSRDILLSYISHELRTPITSISGYLTALNDGIIKNENEVKEAMEIVGSTTVILKKLVDDLDQLSKLETHQFTFDFMECEVIDLIDYYLRECELKMKTTSISFDICYNICDMRNHKVVVDQERMGQVFSNLLNNAIKYSARESLIKIEFEVDEKNKLFMVDVINSGSDIPPKDLLYIFDKYYRVKSFTPSSSKGRGLGLAIAKEIVQAHKGEIYAKKNEEDETVFSFTIPLFEEALDVERKNIGS